jgi:hypothetical protein
MYSALASELLERRWSIDEGAEEKGTGRPNLDIAWCVNTDEIAFRLAL